MKKVYFKPAGSLLVLAASLIMAACSSSLSYNDAMQKNISRIDDDEKQEDAKFLVEAASFNMLAMQMAEVAIESGYSASLVRLARENYEEHDDMGDELKRLARKEKVVLPRELNHTHQQKLAELKSEDRRSFDRTYIRLLTELSEEGSEKFSEMAIDGSSEEVRAYAARKLDLFKNHQNELQTVDAELLRTY